MRTCGACLGRRGEPLCFQSPGAGSTGEVAHAHATCFIIIILFLETLALPVKLGVTTLVRTCSLLLLVCFSTGHKRGSFLWGKMRFWLYLVQRKV
jgi:hypothetical protein